MLGYVVFHHFKDSWSSSNHSRQPLLLQELGLPAYLLLILFLFPSRRPKIRGSPVGKRQKRSNQVALGPNLTTFSNFDQKKENFSRHGGNQRHKSSSLSRPTFRPSCTLRTISQKPASVQTQSAVKESQDLAITSNAFPQKTSPFLSTQTFPRRNRQTQSQITRKTGVTIRETKFTRPSKFQICSLNDPSCGTGIHKP